MNAQAIRAGCRNIVLIVMMCEVEVVHDMFPLAIFGHAVRTHKLDG
jgi:hypothetical protein